MLQKIHDRLQGILAFFIVIVLSLMFILWGAAGFADFGTSGADYAAKANGEKIPVRQAREAWQRQQVQLARQFGGNEIPETLKTRMQDQMLEAMIGDALLRSQVKKVGYGRVSEEDVQREVQQIPAFQVEGKYSPQAARYALTTAGLSEAELETSLRGELERRQFENTFQDSAFITPAELAFYWKVKNEQREATWLVISAASFADRVKPDDATIQAYYDGHKQTFMTAETVTLKYVRLRAEDMTSRVQITEEGLRAYFETVKDLYRYLDGPQKDKPKTFEDARKDLEVEYRKTEADKLFSDQQEKLSDLAFENLHDLSAVAAALKLPVNEIPGFAKDKGAGDLSGKPQVTEAAFSDTVLKGENSKPIELKPGDVVVVASSGYQAAQQKPLAEVRDTIVNSLKQQMARDEALKLARQSVVRLQAGSETFQRLGTELKAKVEGPKFVSRQEESIPYGVRTALFSLPHSTAQNFAVYKDVPVSGGDVAVLAFSGVRVDPTPTPADQLRNSREHLTADRGTQEFTAYTSALRASAKVDKNPKAFE